jgi:hypothetical protein
MMPLGTDHDIAPRWLPSPDDERLDAYRTGYDDVDRRILAWILDARRDALAYRRSLRPQTEAFARLLDAFDRQHQATSVLRRALLWRMISTGIAINRLLEVDPFDAPTFSRCCIIHHRDFAEVKASGFPELPVVEEYHYLRMAASLVRASARGAP